MAILVTLVCENSCNKAVTEAESNASILNSSVSVTFLLISYGLRENWRQRTAINLKKKKRDVCIASENRILLFVNSRVKIKTQTPSTLSPTSIPGRGKEERAWNRGYVQVVCRMRSQEFFFSLPLWSSFAMSLKLFWLHPGSTRHSNPWIYQPIACINLADRLKLELSARLLHWDIKKQCNCELLIPKKTKMFKLHFWYIIAKDS